MHYGGYSGAAENRWIIRINGLVDSQRKTIATNNPEFIIDERTGELSTCGGKVLTPDLTGDFPISKITAYLNLLANFKYKVVSSTTDRNLFLWTLQAV